MPIFVLLANCLLVPLRPDFFIGQRQGWRIAVILECLPPVCKHTEVSQQRCLLGYRILPQLSGSRHSTLHAGPSANRILRKKVLPSPEQK